MSAVIEPLNMEDGERMGPGSAVLVADDDRDCADTVVSLLELNGFEARAAYDGTSAVALGLEWQPDSAILDIAMPGASGLDVARRLRESRGRDIRLIAYTAWSAVEDQTKAIAAGFDDILPKGCEPEDLLLVLGPESREVVIRSIAVNSVQVRLQMDLASSLIDHARITVDHVYRERICEFVGRRLDLLDTRLLRQPMVTEERDKVERRLNALREKLWGL